MSERSLKIRILGLVGYLKLICLSSISPFRFSKMVPDSSLGSMSDLLSKIANMEAVALLALLESGANVLDWDTATAAMFIAKKTYTNTGHYQNQKNEYIYVHRLLV